MEITIHRHRIKEATCDGTLCIDGLRICDTTENSKYRPSAGTYRIALKYSKVHGRKVPVLMSLEKEAKAGAVRSCLAIGNGVFGSKDGRIILGRYIVPGCVKRSREPFMHLYDRINNSMRRGNEVTLTITE